MYVDRLSFGMPSYEAVFSLCTITTLFLCDFLEASYVLRTSRAILYLLVLDDIRA